MKVLSIILAVLFVSNNVFASFGAPIIDCQNDQRSADEEQIQILIEGEELSEFALEQAEFSRDGFVEEGAWILEAVVVSGSPESGRADVKFVVEITGNGGGNVWQEEYVLSCRL